jgi:hypothetical protein
VARELLYSGLMDVELARQQWEDGNRRIESARDDVRLYRTLLEQVDVVVAELRKRVGQTFTLSELADAYDGADYWARDAVDVADPDEPPPPDVPAVAGAAFHQYARGATDYRP